MINPNPTHYARTRRGTTIVDVVDSKGNVVVTRGSYLAAQREAARRTEAAARRLSKLA